MLAALLVPFDAAAGSRRRPPTRRCSSRTTGARGRARSTSTSDYIKNTAEAIDEDARRAGVFEEVRTVTPAPGTATDWTHLRIFRLKNAAAEQALGAGLDAATLRVVPDEATAQGEQRAVGRPARSGAPRGVDPTSLGRWSAAPSPPC